jgi:hypothetical protein
VTPERRFFVFVAQYPSISIRNYKRGIRAATGPQRFFLELAVTIGVLTSPVKRLDLQQGRCG